MTHLDLRQYLADAGLSQRRSAKLIGVDERTMRRYVAGHSPIPRYIELAVRYVATQQLIGEVCGDA